MAMKTIGKTRKYLFLSFAAAGLLAGFIASVTPSEAKYVCGWTPRGTVCNYEP
jgi:cell division protein FtsX